MRLSALPFTTPAPFVEYIITDLFVLCVCLFAPDFFLCFMNVVLCSSSLFGGLMTLTSLGFFCPCWFLGTLEICRTWENCPYYGDEDSLQPCHSWLQIGTESFQSVGVAWDPSLVFFCIVPILVYVLPKQVCKSPRCFRRKKILKNKKNCQHF